LNSLWQTQGLPLIKMRVGIHTGPLVAGSLGGSQRLEYTVLGDTVNIAARLESFSKDDATTHPPGSVCRILIGESTRNALDEQFQTEPVGAVRLKGKQLAVSVYRVLDYLEIRPGS
jgi:adenylate cyclase